MRQRKEGSKKTEELVFTERKIERDSSGGRFTSVALSAAIDAACVERVEHAFADPTCSVVRLAGMGDDFCLGADAGTSLAPREVVSAGSLFAGLSRALLVSGKVVVSMCHGKTLGGGMLFPCASNIVCARSPGQS